MSNRSAKLLVQDILTSSEKIQRYTANMSLEEFTLDDKTADAVARNFEIIGEAAKRLPNDFKAGSSQIDWDRIRGFRNRIVHDYFGIDFSIVWNIVQKFLPDLISHLKAMMDVMDDLE